MWNRQGDPWLCDQDITEVPRSGTAEVICECVSQALPNYYLSMVHWTTETAIAGCACMVLNQ